MIDAGPISFVRLKSGGYRLDHGWWVDTGIIGCAAQILSRQGVAMVALDSEGLLHVTRGYQWDGASGPVIDRKANMRAGLAHDALYQLHRAGRLPEDLRAASDAVYRELYVECGGWRWLSWIDYAGLRLFAGYAAKPQREVETRKLVA